MSTTTRQTIGRRIRTLRKAAGLSQERLSLMVGVERSYLAKLELGKRNPTVDCLERIATGLDVPLYELFRDL